MSFDEVPAESKIYEGRTCKEEISYRVNLSDLEDDEELAETSGKLTFCTADQLKGILETMEFKFERMFSAMARTSVEWWYHGFETRHAPSASSHVGSGLHQLYLQECGYLLRDPMQSTSIQDMYNHETKMEKEKDALRQHKEKYSRYMDSVGRCFTKMRDLKGRLIKEWDTLDTDGKKERLRELCRVSSGCYVSSLYVVMEMLPGRTFLRNL